MALGEWKIANSQKINNQIKSSNSGAKAYALKALKSLEVSHSLPLDNDISATINQSNTEQGADQTVPLGSETPKKVSRELEFPPLPCKPSSPGATPAIILDVPRRTVSPLRNTKKVAASAAKTTTSKPKKNKRVSVPPPHHTVPNECIYDVPPPVIHVTPRDLTGPPLTKEYLSGSWPLRTYLLGEASVCFWLASEAK